MYHVRNFANDAEFETRKAARAYALKLSKEEPFGTVRLYDTNNVMSGEFRFGKYTWEFEKPWYVR